MTSVNDEITLTIMVESYGDEEDKIAGVRVSPKTSIELLKTLISIECNITLDNRELVYRNRVLKDSDVLESLGIKSDDAVIVRHKMNSTMTSTTTSATTSLHNNNNNNNNNYSNNLMNNNTSAIAAESLDLGMPVFGPNSDIPPIPAWLNMDPSALQNTIRADSALMAQLLHNNPRLAEAILSEDITALTQYMIQQRFLYQQQVSREQQRRMALEADPLNPEHQRLIETEITQANVYQNYEAAVEEMPEAFGRVVMLYVPMEVEGVSVNAFIDSGAQTTIMSAKMAERCGLLRLVDRRFRGIAKGVGTANIVGRVHMAKLKFGSIYLPCSFTIMEDPEMEFLFGLDMLRRHQAVIDLHKNVLRIGTEEVAFLQEKDIPHLRTANLEDLQRSQMEAMGLADLQSPRANDNDKDQKADKDKSDTNNRSNKPSDNDIPMREVQPNTNPTTQQRNNRIKPEDIATLRRNFNCTENDAINALSMTGGNVEMAASLLFQTFSGGLGFD